MGAHFDLSHINLVGYLTDETGLAAPRSDLDTIGKFLMSLAYGQNLISSTQGSPDDWARKVEDEAGDQLSRLNFQFGDPTNDRPVNSRRYLDPLKSYFTGYDFYALVLPAGDHDRDDATLRFFREAGYSSGANGLVLLPSQRYEPGLAQFVDPFPALRVLADQPIVPPGVLLFLVVTNRRSGSELSLVVDRDQILKVVVQGNSVKLIHEAPASNFSEVSFAIDPNQPLVIGARAGKDPRNILLMVNGEYRTLTVKQTGTPLNFNYLESSLSLTNIQETLIFKRAMEPGEINVISRQIASQYNIPTKTSNTMPDYLAWSNESALFPQVRTIMRNSCFRCHTSWISLSESGFTTASSYTKNIQLVKPKSLEESPLWHSLKGSVDN